MGIAKFLYCSPVLPSLLHPSEPHMATPTRSSPLCASSGDHSPQEQDKLTRTLTR